MYHFISTTGLIINLLDVVLALLGVLGLSGLLGLLGADLLVSGGALLLFNKHGDQ